MAGNGYKYTQVLPYFLDCWIDEFDEIAHGKTPREAMDNAMLNGKQNVI